MSRTRDALIGVLIALTLAAALRGVWLTADPPTTGTVGIVWHDEGAWVHNARNKALWGAWRTDAWNPVFIAPVFTLLEYAAFRELGVGTWQARTVPLVSGLFAIIGLAAGLAAIGGARAAVIGATFLATNYVFVMWNRAALMESTMTAFMAAAWGAYALAHARHPAWGFVSGMLAVLAWFSKAAAAFFIAAIVFDALSTVLLGHLVRLRNRFSIDAPSAADVRAARLTLAGLAVTAGLIVAAFVLPHWGEYRFYNWQMSVTRKPSYALGALLDRASWLPLVQDSFTRMWMVLVAAAAAVMTLVWRWRAARPAERLLVLWVVLGIAELVVHDAGNERRYVMFVPVLVALASLAIAGSPAVTRDGPDTPRWMLIAGALFAYLVVGSMLRMAFLGDIRAGQLQLTVRLSAIASVPLALFAAARWNMVSEWLARQRPSPMAIALLAAIVVGGDLVQYTQWARVRTGTTIGLRARSGRCSQTARWYTASSPMDCRSRIASGRSSSGTASATTRTGPPAMTYATY